VAVGDAVIKVHCLDIHQLAINIPKAC